MWEAPPRADWPGLSEELAHCSNTKTLPFFILHPSSFILCFPSFLLFLPWN
jgi:hypothetical protein